MLRRAPSMSAWTSGRARSGPTIRRPLNRRVRVEEVEEALHHRLVVGDEHRVPGAGETLARGVERRHQGWPLVGHQVLGVVFHDRIGVPAHDRAHLLERVPQLLQPFAPALGAHGEQRVHGNPALERTGQGIQHLEVVAPEER